MADIASDDLRPDPVWRALGHHLATGCGALAALLSLLAGTRVTTASLRGAGVLFAVLLLTRLGSAALAAIERAEGGDAANPAPAPAPDVEPTPEAEA